MTTNFAKIAITIASLSVPLFSYSFSKYLLSTYVPGVEVTDKQEIIIQRGKLFDRAHARC